MSHQELTMEGAQKADLGKMQYAGLLVGGVCLLGLLGMSLQSNDTTAVAQSFLYGRVYWAALTFGMLGVILLHHTVRGSWTLSILRLLEAGSSRVTFGLMGLLFIPIVLSYQKLYPWAMHEYVTKDSAVMHRAGWENPTAFTIRTFLLLAVWALVGGYMRNSALKQDENGDKGLAQKRMNGAAPGIVFYVLSMTVLATDWIMSLDPHWYSTMFGPLLVIGPSLSALSLTTFLICVNKEREPYSRIMKLNLQKDLGNMMFTFTMLWGYFNFSQYLIIWNGNLPSTVGYFYHRSIEQWLWVGGLVIIGQFFVPWFALLSPRIKANPNSLGMVAAWIFLMQIIDIYYIVVPMFRTTGPMPMLTDVLAWVGVGGLWVYVFCGQIKRVPLYPSHDRRLLEADDHA